MVKDEKKKPLIKFILFFLVALIISAIILFWFLPLLNLSSEFKASIIGFVIILLGISLILFKIILEEYFEMVNPGSNALQRTIQFLIIGGLIIIALSILSLMEVIPLF
jgi:hypothetical protein